MKYLLLLAIVFAVLWLMRSLRKPAPPTRREARGKASRPGKEDMVACDLCGVHLPRSEALPGRGGVFCSDAHRSTFEQQRSR